MGYRSEVAYVVVFENKDEPEIAHKNYLMFQEWVKQHTVPKTDTVVRDDHFATVDTGELYTYDEMFKDFGGDKADENYYFRWIPERGMLVFYSHWSKWYESFPEVQWHEKLLEEVPRFDGVSRFIRIGEEWDDCECKDYGHNDGISAVWEVIDLERRINISLPDELLTNDNKEAA
jgi:hypothetical protein